MKKDIILICLLLGGVCLFLILRPTGTHAPAPEHQIDTGVSRSSSLRSQVATNEALTVQPMATALTSNVGSAALERSNALYQQMLSEWQAPIDFYGKVIDENSNGVSGARISFRWIETPTEGEGKSSFTQSDSQGLFSLHGERGASLDVSVSKLGYYASRGGQQSFVYSMSGHYSANPQNPVTFVLRKKGSGVDLLTSDNGFRTDLPVLVPKDGTSVKVDLLEKTVNATGQLEISQNKPPWQEATQWSFNVSIPGGGLVENSDEFQFNAPDSNYQSAVEYTFTKTETNWITHVTKQFYIVFGQPRKYGWLRIESDLTQETIFLTYAINPSGSSNLEPMNR